jgi:hypothetical protein
MYTIIFNNKLLIDLEIGEKSDLVQNWKMRKTTNRRIKKVQMRNVLSQKYQFNAD